MFLSSKKLTLTLNSQLYITIEKIYGAFSMMIL